MKETLKSIALFILFIMALVLTYLNTLQPFFVVSSDGTDATYSISLHAVVKPHTMIYSDGVGNYGVLLDTTGVERQIVREVREVFNGAEILEPIDKKRFVESFGKKSILMKTVGLDRSYFTDSGELGDFYCYDEILVDQSGYYVRQNDAYFSVKTDRLLDIDALEEAIVLDKTEVYRRIYDRFSLKRMLGDSEVYLNYNLIPYGNISKVVRSSTKPEFVLEDRDSINEIAKSVLGDRLDFTQIFVDSANSIVFVYNKGEKSLTFTQDGRVLFKSRPQENQKAKKTDFESALRVAIGFVANSGGVPEGMVLNDCSLGENGEYYFDFSYRIAGKYPVVGSGCGIYVMVKDDSVLEMSRRVVIPEVLFTSYLKTHVPVDQCINNYLDLFGVEGDSERFYLICSKLEEVKTVYYYRNAELVPTWQIRVEGRDYWFDIETGEHIAEQGPGNY